MPEGAVELVARQRERNALAAVRPSRGRDGLDGPGCCELGCLDTFWAYCPLSEAPYLKTFCEFVGYNDGDALVDGVCRPGKFIGKDEHAGGRVGRSAEAW